MIADRAVWFPAQPGQEQCAHASSCLREGQVYHRRVNPHRDEERIMTTQNEGRDTQGGNIGRGTGGASSSAGNLGKQGEGMPDVPAGNAAGGRPAPDELTGALEANANAEGFATGERTTELEDGMGDLGAQETTAAGPHLSPHDTVHRGAAATELNPTHQGTAGIPEQVERLEEEKFPDQGTGEPAP